MILLALIFGIVIIFFILMASLKRSLDELKSKISILQDDTARISDDIDNIQDRVIEIQKIEKINQDVENRKISKTHGADIKIFNKNGVELNYRNVSSVEINGIIYNK